MEIIQTAACPLWTFDGRRLARILKHYREPSHVRSTVGIVITFVPLVTLWAMAWAALHSGYWWLCLLLALPPTIPNFAV